MPESLAAQASTAQDMSCPGAVNPSRPAEHPHPGHTQTHNTPQSIKTLDKAVTLTGVEAATDTQHPSTNTPTSAAKTHHNPHPRERALKAQLAQVKPLVKQL